MQAGTTCTAVNDIGTAVASAHLIVEDAGSTKQKDLHKELSALRVDLGNISILAPGSKHGSCSVDAQAGPLDRGYKYEFKVRPYGGELYGRESNTRLLRVPEIAPGAPPLAVSVAVDPEQNHTVHLSWDPPPHDGHNGIIQGYQIWCVDLQEQQYQNWTVDSGRHRLEISSLAPSKRYSVVVAAVNGAGTRSGAVPPGLDAPRSGRQAGDVLAILRNPLVIGSACALLWLASEDLIIKHRMAAPDSPWMSGAWRPMHCNTDAYNSLWAGGQEKAYNRASSLPVMSKKDPSYLDSSVRIVPDSCGVYGTFYVDLVGGGLKTFNSPARRPRMHHGPPEQEQQQHHHHHHGLGGDGGGGDGGETIRIAAGPVAKTTALPWKQAIPPRPRMGVLREPWEKSQSKQELHAVKSVPLLSTAHQVRSPNAQRPGHLASRRPEGVQRLVGSPRLLHYSASLHLLDVLPPPPPPPPPQDDARSLSSDEGSSRSTKLTVDMGSLQSVSTGSGEQRRGYPSAGPLRHVDDDPNPDPDADPDPEADGPSYSRQSTVSYCGSLDKSAMTSQEATQYLELSHALERHGGQSEQPTTNATTTYRSFSPDPGYVCGPLPPEPQGMDHHHQQLQNLQNLQHHNLRHPHRDDRSAPGLSGSGRPRLWSTPSSCYSELEGAGSVWSTWASMTDGSGSARTSVVSSADGSSASDGSFARFMTLTSVGGASASG
ncbi:hypothetical protein CRUP_025765 [Coryphaenoides rupestris]|nr:hypothetical protein CRUP_025765 [Coryphaenoides rupestris]